VCDQTLAGQAQHGASRNGHTPVLIVAPVEPLVAIHHHIEAETSGKIGATGIDQVRCAIYQPISSTG
jgi:hypothetical protein